MKVLVLGGTGATGKLLVTDLLSRDIEVIVVVRSKERIPRDIVDNKLLTVVEDSITTITLKDAQKYVLGCDAVVSCLGHNLTFKGIYGKPHKLVYNAVKIFCSAAISVNPKKPIKFLLMNTTGNRNPDAKEKISIGQHLVVALIRLLLPPHRDNESASKYLRNRLIDNGKSIEWTAIRPDTLIDLDKVTEYTIHESPTRSAIFNAGKTSRINVAHFMSELICNTNLWSKWRSKMPVIYNKKN